MQKSLAATEEQEEEEKEKASHSLAAKASTCRHFAEGERRREGEEEIARGKEAERERQEECEDRARRFCSGSDISGQNGGRRRKEEEEFFPRGVWGRREQNEKRVQLGGQNGGEDVSAPVSCKAGGVRLPTSPRLSGEHRGGRAKVFERIP